MGKLIKEICCKKERLKEVDSTSRVYLIRNGHGEYGILTMAEIAANYDKPVATINILKIKAESL